MSSGPTLHREEYHVPDGFYRIMSEGLGAYCPTVVPSNEGGYSVRLSEETHQRWRLSRQHGTKDSYTIVPKDTPDQVVDDSQGGWTTCVKDELVNVERSIRYPIWKVECEWYLDYPGSRVRLIRIREFGTNKCWTRDWFNIRLAEAKDGFQNDQLYRILEDRMYSPLPLEVYEERVRVWFWDVHPSSLERDDGSHKSSNLAGVRLNDGLYRIAQRQHKDVANRFQAYASGVNVQTNDTIMMRVDPASAADSFEVVSVWRLTRQNGIENSFSLSPENTAIGRVCVTDGSVQLGRSGSCPLWNIECERHWSLKDSKGHASNPLSFFSIWEVGTNKCWTADERGNIQLAEVTGKGLSERQLFHFLEVAIKEATKDDQMAMNKEKATISSFTHLSMAATDDMPVKKLYFATNKLSAGDLDRFRSIQLETDAYSQGWIDKSPPGDWSWFELAIFSELPAEAQEVTDQHIKSSRERKPLTWVSHKIRPAEDLRSGCGLGEAVKYRVVTGQEFTKQHDMWKFLEEGDYLGVLACAQYRGWVCDVRRATLIIRKLGIKNT